MTRDIRLGVDDLREQLKYSLQSNKEFALYKLMSPEDINKTSKNNLLEFKSTVKNDFIEKNIKICLKELVSARVTSKYISDMGIFRWKIKFSPRFKFFKNQDELDRFKKETSKRIDEFIEEKVLKQIQDIESLI